MAKVTIVVIAHSVRDELARCFASIREHAGIPVRTILVDNASTDGTLDWVRQAHPEVEVIGLAENLVDAARDRAMGGITSKYTMFLDSDAMLTHGALPAMVEAMEVNPTWGLIGPRLVRDDGSVQESCRRFPPSSSPSCDDPRWGASSSAGRRFSAI